MIASGDPAEAKTAAPTAPMARQTAAVVRGERRAHIGAGTTGPGAALWVEVEEVTEPEPTADTRALAAEYKKLLLAMLVMNLATTLSFTLYTYSRQKQAIMDGIDQTLQASAQAVRLIADEVHDRLAVQSEIPPDTYRAWLDALSALAARAGVEYLYTVARHDGGLGFTLSSYTAQEGAAGDFNRLYDPYPDPSVGLLAAFADGQIQYDQYTDEWGTFRSIFIPARSPDGGEYVIGADIALDDIARQLRRTLWDCLLMAGLMFVGMLGLSWIVARSLRREVAVLAHEVDRIAEGELGVCIPQVTDDELGRLGTAINGMAHQ